MNDKRDACIISATVLLGFIISALAIFLEIGKPLLGWYYINLTLLGGATVLSFVLKGRKKLNTYIASTQELDTSSVTDQDILAFMNYKDTIEERLTKRQIQVRKRLQHFIDNTVLYENTTDIHWKCGHRELVFMFEKIEVATIEEGNWTKEKIATVPKDHKLFKDLYEKAESLFNELTEL